MEVAAAAAAPEMKIFRELRNVKRAAITISIKWAAEVVRTVFRKPNLNIHQPKEAPPVGRGSRVLGVASSSSSSVAGRHHHHQLPSSWKLHFSFSPF